jgi:prenylcysteine oxidase/farnesylcysteine lyase
MTQHSLGSPTFTSYLLHQSIMAIIRLSQRSQLVLSVVILSLLTYWLASAPSKTGFPRFKSEPDFKYPSEAHPKAIAQERPKRIAIVGAGASGSAAAWFMSRAGRVMKERVGREVLGDVIVFEQSDRVGGR